MQEDSVDVYLRHRDELLKAIYGGSDTSQEVGDFLLSTINLKNHGIEYDLRDEDIVCLSYSNFCYMFLRKVVFLESHYLACGLPISL